MHPACPKPGQEDWKGSGTLTEPVVRQKPGWVRTWKPGRCGFQQQQGFQSCELVLVTPLLFPLLSCPAQDLCLVREGLCVPGEPVIPESKIGVLLLERREWVAGQSPKTWYLVFGTQGSLCEYVCVHMWVHA